MFGFDALPGTSVMPVMARIAVNHFGTSDIGSLLSFLRRDWFGPGPIGEIVPGSFIRL
jgi:hypothetical protein